MFVHSTLPLSHIHWSSPLDERLAHVAHYGPAIWWDNFHRVNGAAASGQLHIGCLRRAISFVAAVTID
jgi:hypothetical protein